MAEMNERDTKLVQYLSEAYGKERELETALQAHIAMTTKRAYRKRLEQHLRETRAHAKAVERRIKKLGGGGQLTQTLVGKAMAAAKGPLHAVRGSGDMEKMLKNAKTEYFNEHEEIGTYLSIETLAEKVRDSETARLAKGIRREEERMARFLQGQIKSLTGAVAVEQVPSAQRRPPSRQSGAAQRRSQMRQRRWQSEIGLARQPQQSGQSQTCSKISPLDPRLSRPIEARGARRRSVGLPGLKI